MSTAERRFTTPSALLFLLVCAVYAGSLSNGFHFDDFHSVVRNPHLRQLSQIPSFFIDPTAFSVNPESAMYRPLLLTTFALDHALWGGRAWGYHAVSILLHGLAAVAVLRLVSGLGFAPRVAQGAALVFAVHPINSEAVCYVSSRSELLMSLCVLAACVAFLHLRRSGAHGAAALTGAGLVCALLTKSVAVVAPALLVVLDGFVGGWQSIRRGWRLVAAVSLPAASYLLVVRQPAARALVDDAVRGLEAQVWTQMKAVSYYLWLAAMPTRLNVEHQFFAARGLTPAVWTAGLLVVSTLVVIGLWRRRCRWLTMAVGWSAVWILPSSIVPLIVLVNEHRLYGASVGLALVVSMCLSMLPRRPLLAGGSVASVGLGAYTCLLAVLSLQRTAVWQSELTLWTDSAAKSPAILRPHLRYADALLRAGLEDEAETEYLHAIALRPRHPGARTNLGLLYQSQGKPSAAAEHYEALLRVSPDSVPARLNLAGLRLRDGRWREAQAHYQQALEHDPTGGRAQIQLGHIALRYEADAAAALGWYDAALKAGAAVTLAQSGRGVALRQLGDSEAAETAYQAVLAADSTRADVWYNLGNLYQDRGSLPAAVDAYRAATRHSDEAALARRAQERIRELEQRQPTR